jgi:Zn-dependent protease
MNDLALRFRVGGIPVVVRPIFFLLPVLLSIDQAGPKVFAWVAIVFCSVLLHELGHAWVMESFGGQPSIVLHAMGGATSWPAGARPGPGQRLLVSLAGPGIQLFIGGVVFTASRAFNYPPQFDWVVDQLLWVNVGWALINLVPIVPWDGGNALDAFIAWVDRPRPMVTVVVSGVGGIALAAYAFTHRQFVLGYIGAVGVQQAWSRYSSIPPALESLELAAKTRALTAQEWFWLGQGLYAQGRLGELPSLIRGQIAKGLAESVSEGCKVLYQTKQFDVAAPLFQEAFAAFHHGTDAYNAACCLARLGRGEEAVHQLSLALDANYVTSKSRLLTDADLQSLRERPDFVAQVERAGY